MEPDYKRMTSLVGIDYGGAKAGVIHQNRLALVGSGALGDLLLVSTAGDWTNFATTRDDGDGNQVATNDDGFWQAQHSSLENELSALIAQEGMFLFGNAGELTVPAGPFNNAQTVVNENSWYGTDIGKSPFIVAGQVVFAQAGGGDIRAIRWTEQQRKYEAPSLRELTPPEIFEGIRAMTWTPSNEQQADTLYVVGGDGQLAVCALRINEPRVAWALWSLPEAEIVSASGEQRALFLVKRHGEVQLEIFAGEAEPGDPLLDVPMTVDLASESAVEVPVALRGILSVGFESAEGQPVLAEVELEAGSRWWVRGEEGSSGAREPLFVTANQDPFAGDEAAVRTALRTAFVEGRTRQVRPRDGEEAEAPLTVAPWRNRMQIGVGYRAVLETLPFVARTQTGTRRGVTKSRIFGAYIDFADAAPATIEVNERPRTPRPYPDRRRKTGESVRLGGLQGWRRRQTMQLRFDAACSIAGLFYRNKG